MILNKDKLRYLRHELRTYLNHVSGYSEIIKEAVQEVNHNLLLEDASKLDYESQNLINAFHQSFYKEGQALEDFDMEYFKKTIFGPLYIVIGLAQRLKKLSEDKAPVLIPDLEKILESCRAIQELVEKEINIMVSDSLSRTQHFGIGVYNKDPMDASAWGSILVVEDNEINRDILIRQLERQGHKPQAAQNGFEALKMLRENTFDLVLLDVLMPGLNGYQVLEKIKSDPDLKHIPVIMISALEETESVIQCIALGAEDYLSKSYDPVLLKARISASLDKKRSRDKELLMMEELKSYQILFERELAEAATYVRGLLPTPLRSQVCADWVFQPSKKLGGDFFDYHWIDDQHLAIYLLDVSGHGIGAALLSVSVMNVLRSQSLPNADFMKPHSVLEALNHAFPMEHQNNMYFTIWYGVYNSADKTMSFASAGAPPAILIHWTNEEPVYEQLTTTDMIIGVDMDYQYETRKHEILAGSRLYLFSDGVYEVKKNTNKMMIFKEFTDILSLHPRAEGSHVLNIFHQIQGLTGTDRFDDDFSLLEICF